MASSLGVNQGKTKFVREQLARDNAANLESVNRAWTAAGNKDEISRSLVQKVRSRMGLSGKKDDAGVASEEVSSPAAKDRARSSSKAMKPRSAAKPAGAAPSPASAQSPAVRPATRTGSAPVGDQEQMLDTLEAGIDDLMFQLKVNGGLPEAEAKLREVRRILTRSQGE